MLSGRDDVVDGCCKNFKCKIACKSKRMYLWGHPFRHYYPDIFRTLPLPPCLPVAACPSSQCSLGPSEPSITSIMSAENEPSGTAAQPTPDMHPTSPPESGEQALESLPWAEVIELKTFSERKAWIEEKTKVASHSVVHKSMPSTLPPVFGTNAAYRGVRRDGSRPRLC